MNKILTIIVIAANILLACYVIRQYRTKHYNIGYNDAIDTAYLITKQGISPRIAFDMTHKYSRWSDLREK